MSNEELYRYEYLVSSDPERDSADIDSVVMTEFILAESEVDALIQATQYDGNGVYGVRKANDQEVVAYNSGFEDGTELAIARERLENYNGVSHRVKPFSSPKLETDKFFRCGGCDKQFEFDDAVMVGKNHLMKLVGPNQTPWHVCIKCV